MSQPIDPALHWTDHFVRYGFAVLKGLVSRDFCQDAMTEAQRLLGHDLPPRQWDSDNTPTWHKAFRDGEGNDVFDRVFDQPGVRQAIDELFGAERWNQVRNYYLFLKPYDPQAEAKLAQRGHIDFGSQPIPVLYRGFNFQVSLLDAEPFSGNLTVHPGSHIAVQKRVMANPELRLGSGNVNELEPPLPLEPPYEFVGEAGDVLFHSHLLVHSGNVSHAANHTPRVALHCDAYQEDWLRHVDPADPAMGPWELSLAQNGPYTMPDEQIEAFIEHRRKSGDKQYA